MSYRRWIACVAVAATVTDCVTPYSAVHLEPAYNSVVWVQGGPAVWMEQSDVRVATAFNGQDDAMLGLGVELANNSYWELEVDPNQFTYTTCSGETLATCKPTRPVFAPERMLALLDQRQQRSNGQAGVGVLLAILAVAAVVVAVGVSTGRGPDPEPDTDCDHHDHYDASDSPAVPQQPPLDRNGWVQTALRKTTIPPGGVVGGVVFVPVDVHARYVWLNVRAADEWFSFRYRQTVSP